jgi:hypothetical protein
VKARRTLSNRPPASITALETRCMYLHRTLQEENAEIQKSQKGSHRGEKTNAAHPPIGGEALASLGLDERPIRRLPPPGSLLLGAGLPYSTGA